MLFRIFYNTAQVLLGIGLLPMVLWKALHKNKYRKSFWARLSGKIPFTPSKNGQVIWIHAVSVGEVRGVSPLAKRLKEEHPNCQIVISTITETGQAEAKKSLPFAACHFFLPFDFSWLMNYALKTIQPDLLLLSETDFWPNMLVAAKNVGVKIALVNGKISAKSTRRLSWWPQIFDPIDLFCIQHPIFGERFKSLGVAESKMEITGNLKCDIPPSVMTTVELNNWKERLGIKVGERVITLGSTHDPEESELLDALDSIQPAKILIVPRHPERFDAVAKILKKRGLSFDRYSATKRCSENVILIDAMGQLHNCYQVSYLAIVGGSFVARLGGHNILEPCYYGVPVLFGPFMQTQPDLTHLVLTAKAGLQVSMSDLPKTLSSLLSQPHLHPLLSENGGALIKNIQGATEKTLESLHKKLLY